MTRDHNRLLAELLLFEGKRVMKAEWFHNAYDGTNLDNDRDKWYKLMDELVEKGFVERTSRNYGTAGNWNYYQLTIDGEIEIIRLMETETDDADL